MSPYFYGITEILSREKIGGQDEDRDALIAAIANENNT